MANKILVKIHSMPNNRFMKRTVNKELMKSWIKENGFGPLEEKGLSHHTLRTMAYGNYVSEPKALTISIICEATGLAQDDLFPLVEASDGDGPEAA